jgi:hypothetical protein
MKKWIPIYGLSEGGKYHWSYRLVFLWSAYHTVWLLALAIGNVKFCAFLKGDIKYNDSNGVWDVRYQPMWDELEELLK